MESLITALRAHTRAQHSDLESVTRLPQSLTGLSALREVLCNFFCYYRELDCLLKKSSRAGLPLTVRNRPFRSNVLLQDLALLGVGGSALAKLPSCTGLPQQLTLHQLWGVHYVIEGSALGGKIVRSHMLKQPELAPLADELRFFNVYGADTAIQWKRFSAELNSLELTDAGQMEVINGAKFVFTTLIDWFQSQHAQRSIIA
ncbi:MAG: biliverdin-producing heme oxygenase [Granulosicoccus sp.]